MNRKMVCVILAGGKGKRMASSDRHKVCFPIAGRPAICRAIDAYKAAGIKQFLVVVGTMAQQVIATVGESHPEVSFVFQAQARGTGHAAAVAAEALAAAGFDGDVMIVMGDKYTQPRVVHNLIEDFDKTKADVAVAALPKGAESTAGRLVERNGAILGNVELADIKAAREKNTKISLAGRQFTPDQVEKFGPTVNASMYIFRFTALHEALKKLSPNNAQGELYLTDTIEYLARKGRIASMLVSDPTDLMAYNTPAELLAIEEVFRQRQQRSRVAQERKPVAPDVIRPAKQWLALLEGEGLTAQLIRIYGRDKTLLADRRAAITRLVKEFIRMHGPNRSMILCRAPGRVNLMGRHVDHRGGYVNVMAISREVLLAAAPREDDVVSLRNLDRKKFPSRDFRIADLLQNSSWASWQDFVASDVVQDELERARGDWSHYARAPLLRLQHECRDMRLTGMDCLVTGNIPMGAGLSSSSALVVAFAEAALTLNGLDVTMRDFIDLCGEGEWFVGSRGGSADHAAIRSSKAGCISRIGFFPFRLEGQVRFPMDLRVVIAHSGSEAIKSAGARSAYNERIACYELAQLLLRKNWPAAAGMEHLRDLTPDRLKVRPGEIYRALMLLPEMPKRPQLRKLLPEHAERLDRLFATHTDPGRYDLRGVALFGLSECIRSDRFASAMDKADLERVGQWMRISHDGDRVVWFDERGNSHKHTVATDDNTLRRLAAAQADLSLQPGRYACSTDALDRLVDLACDTDGVIGAQLSGAGLGGCMMILVHEVALETLIGKLKKDFYQARKLDINMHVCSPVAGAGLLRIKQPE